MSATIAKSAPWLRPKPRSKAAIAVLWGLIVLAALAIVAFVRISPWDHVVSVASSPGVIGCVIFGVGAGILIAGSRVWLGRIDHHTLLTAGEKLQNKDALVIGTYFVVVVHLGLCVTGVAVADSFKDAPTPPIFLAELWALAATAVGSAFGFLFGLPRRSPDDTSARESKPGALSLLKTGLDDIIDWLVKGITAVALVESKSVIEQLPGLAGRLALGMAQSGGQDAAPPPQAAAISLALIVLFTAVGFFGTYLVTRTYLTGALNRADRSTMGALQSAGLTFAEGQLLANSERDLSRKGRTLSSSVKRVAEKLAQVPLDELRTPEELAMWAKAKSALGQTQEAFEGYERAISLSRCNPAVLLDYAVALDEGGAAPGEVLRYLEEAYKHLSSATPSRVRKGVYKSYTYALLYRSAPHGFNAVLELIKEYRRFKDSLPSGGMILNEACAWAQKFRWEGERKNLIKVKKGEIIKLPDKKDWTPEMREAHDNALRALKEAIAYDTGWRQRFRLLLLSKHPEKLADPSLHVENDFEVFETLEEFRAELEPLEAADPANPQEGVANKDETTDDGKT